MNSRRLIASPEAQDKAWYRIKLAHFKEPQPMSALGQKRTCAVHYSMSALPLKADIKRGIVKCPLWANSGHSPRFQSANKRWWRPWH